MSVTASAAGAVDLLASGGASSGTFAAIEDAIDAVFTPISEGLSALVFAEIPLFGVSFPWIVGWLILAALIFTVYFRAPQFRNFRLAIGITRGRYTSDDEPGEIPHFQALTSAVSGTVGLGNIAGVGVAVTIGGAGATFWMICAGLLGMCTKFVECTLGVRYREYHEDGTVSGGPMHYLRRGIAERFPSVFGRNLGKVLAGLAAIFILFFGVAGGNMFQANQTFAQLTEVTGGESGLLGGDGAALIFGIVLALVVGCGDLRRGPVGGARDQPAGTGDGDHLRPRLPHRAPGEPPAGTGRHRRDLRGRVHRRRRRRWCHRRAHRRVPARRLLQRGRAGLGADRPLRGQDPPPRHRGLRRHARALRRHRRDLHDDRPDDRRRRHPVLA